MIFLLVAAEQLQAQQFASYNSRTLFDAFENPAQKAFIADSSRKYAFNFFIPNIAVTAAAKGPAQPNIRYMAFTGKVKSEGLELGNTERNKISANTNNYLAMFRVFKDIKYNREFGFAWQVRSDNFADVTNESIAVLKNYQSLNAADITDPFNNRAVSQTYHQFSFSYREDVTKRLGLGVKLSYLSGILHNNLDIKSSGFDINTAADTYTLHLQGKYQSNFSTDEPESLTAMPGFQNPGAALTIGMNYKLRHGWFLLANVKDLGFIHWNDASYNYIFDKPLTIQNASAPDAYNRLIDKLGSFISKDYKLHGFTSVINSKAEILINKDLGNYQPNLLVSKSLFVPDMDIALINNYRYKNSVFSLAADYNPNRYFQLGGQYMLKSPNFELFIGSDQLFTTYYFAKGMIHEDETIGKENTGASFYFGFAVKFGTPMEHQANSSRIPGFGKDIDNPGFFKRLLSKKKRK